MSELALAARQRASHVLPYLVVIAAIFLVCGFAKGLVLLVGEQQGLKSLFFLVPVLAMRLYGVGPAILAGLLGSAACEAFFETTYFGQGFDWVGLFVRTAAMVSIVAAMAYQATPAEPAEAAPPRATKPRHWNHPPTGDWAVDVAAGAECAERFLRQTRLSRDFFMLGWIVSDIIKAGRMTGVEVGFFEAVSIAAAKGSLARHNFAEHGDRERRIVEPKGPI